MTVRHKEFGADQSSTQGKPRIHGNPGTVKGREATLLIVHKIRNKGKGHTFVHSHIHVFEHKCCHC